MMTVARYPQRLRAKKTVLVLGSFGAIHLGHLKLIEVAKTTKLPITILIFNQIEAIPQKNGPIYATLDVRLQQCANLKIDQALILNFDKKILLRNGKEFLKEIINLTNAKIIVIGQDFAMGFNRHYDAKAINRDYPSTIIVENIKFRQNKLSTSILKELVEVGDVELVRKLSPFPFTISTKVDKNGEFEIKTILPHRGVYAGFVIIDQWKYAAIVRIGFGNNEIIVFNFEWKELLTLVKIELWKLVRPIVKNLHDKIENEDHEKVIKELENNM